MEETVDRTLKLVFRHTLEVNTRWITNRKTQNVGRHGEIGDKKSHGR